MTYLVKQPTHDKRGRRLPKHGPWLPAFYALLRGMATRKKALARAK